MKDEKMNNNSQEEEKDVETPATIVPVVMSTAVNGQPLQVQSVIHSAQSVIQATPIQQAVQVQVSGVNVSEAGEESSQGPTAGGDGEIERKKRQEIRELSRRPSYRRILNELSSDTGPTVSRIEEEPANTTEDMESPGTITIAAGNALQNFPTTIVSSGGTIQLANSDSSVQGLQTLTMTNAGGIPAGAIVQSIQTQDGPQQIFVPAATETSHISMDFFPYPSVNVARLGDVQYQIRPATTLPQGVVMATPASLHTQTQLAEEASRKRELRLMKNREAAKECRRKKKEYIKCLENRVAVLENQNKTLIEELKSLKELYCHKSD
ncbi:cAMP-responsive element modulator [Holothuria leucospilota]|uniref:cAMP-responsive element modulator n=1 Tax=Holothuria leucospilota TaxID=206669 RepID=A0A9Q0YM43_HOLLE|nr:cAMP-responsive element modulator [Holothuria leucospilota]